MELAGRVPEPHVDPKVQAVIAQKFNYPGTNTTTEATLTPDLQARSSRRRRRK